MYRMRDSRTLTGMKFLYRECAAVVLLFGLVWGDVTAQTHAVSSALNDVSAVRPQVRIPLAPLGYFPPGVLPALSNYSLVSLDFIDSNHLLFSFNIAGLMKRSEDCEPNADDTEHKVRAVVLNLPSGSVEWQTEWELSDYAPFLWPLQNGEFLFRRCSQISLLDTHLDIYPYIHTKGQFQLLGLSPDRSLLLLESKHVQHEAAAKKLSQAQPAQSPTELRDIDMNFIRIHPLGVIAVSRTQGLATIPLLQAGFLEVVGLHHSKWQVNLQPYRGELRVVGRINSTCIPQVVALTDSTFLAAICEGYPATLQFYQAYNLHGQRLWQKPVGENYTLPKFSYSANESSVAIAALHTTHAVAALDPLSAEDIDGQGITVYDTHIGKRVLRMMTAPIYTAGGNFALSPHGNRLAVLHNGAIEIYGLNSQPK